ncbi:MAG: DUF1992 domain-containing protein [Desulfovibrionaceae bacterium]|jgi:hypothetical protein|nr:DUF1992 domain-containing protein [Desulfovibrionaceae bacterium]
MNVFTRIAEERIREDMDKGGFDDLPGRGRPLPRDDDALVPEELRMAYKVLKNAGYVPPEVADRKELVSIVEMLDGAGCRDEQERVRQIRKLAVLVARIGAQRGRSVILEEHDEYYRKAVRRVCLEQRKRNGG